MTEREESRINCGFLDGALGKSCNLLIKGASRFGGGKPRVISWAKC